MLVNKTWESLDKWLEKGFHMLKKKKKASQEMVFLLSLHNIGLECDGNAAVLL